MDHTGLLAPRRTKTEAAKIIVVGGTPRQRGGAEMFCDRAIAAMRKYSDRRVEGLPTNTAYLRPAMLRAVASAVLSVLRRNGKDTCIWLQYVTIFDLLF